MDKSASIGWPWPTYPELKECWYICTICWEGEITLEKHIAHRQKLHQNPDEKNVSCLTNGLAGFLDRARTVYNKFRNEDSEIGRIYRNRLIGESSPKLAVGVLDDGSRIYEIDAAGHVTPIAAPGCYGIFDKSQEENLQEVLNRIRSSAEIIAAFAAEDTSKSSCEDQKSLLQELEVIDLTGCSSEVEEMKEQPCLKIEPISSTFEDFLEVDPYRPTEAQPVVTHEETEAAKELLKPTGYQQGSHHTVEPAAEPKPKGHFEQSDCKLDWEINPIVKLVFAKTFNVAKGSVVNLQTGPVKIRYQCKHQMKKTTETTVEAFTEDCDLTMKTSKEVESETNISPEEALKACQTIPDQSTWIYNKYGNRLNTPGAPVIRPLCKSGVVRKKKPKRKFFDLVPFYEEPTKPKEKRRATELSKLTTDEKLLEIILKPKGKPKRVCDTSKNVNHVMDTDAIRCEAEFEEPCYMRIYI